MDEARLCGSSLPAGPIALPALGRSRPGLKNPTWLWWDSNPRPSDPQSDALTTALRERDSIWYCCCWRVSIIYCYIWAHMSAWCMLFSIWFPFNTVTEVTDVTEVTEIKSETNMKVWGLTCRRENHRTPSVGIQDRDSWLPPIWRVFTSLFLSISLHLRTVSLSPIF